MDDGKLPETLADLLRRAAGSWPKREAFVLGTTRLSFGELNAAAIAQAQRLRSSGVTPGQHVGVLGPNHAATLIAILGASVAGAVVVPLSTRYRPPELEYVVTRSGLARVMRIDESANVAITEPGADAARSQAGVALMMFTSGTTANPKGCLIRHDTLLRGAAAMAFDRYSLTPDDRMWNPLPMFHMSALHPFAACLWSGATFVSMAHFEPEAAMAQIRSEGISVLYPAFTTLANALVESPTFRMWDQARLRRVNCVGAADVLARLQRAFPHAVLTSVYGLTEAGGVVAYGSPDDSEDVRMTTCGVPFEGVSVRVEEGELQLKGWCVFDGYYGEPDATRDALTADGWLRTGDLGGLDASGNIRFLGRLKDVLKVGGENVATAEIESMLGGHPAVKFAQVLGIPDERYGEVPVAAVELRDGHDVSASALIEYCRARLAGFKVPREIRFVREWPMSATKIQKSRLKDLFSV